MPNWSWLIVVIWLYSPAHAVAVERTITLYHGKYADEKLVDIVTAHHIDFEDSYISVFAPAITLFTPKAKHQWELEGQIAKHSGDQTHWEFNFAFIVRWKAFPWNQYIKTTAAIGDGLSYATDVPPLELANNSDTGATKLLNYFVMEATFAPPSAKQWSIVTRIHHRSGIFGIFDDVRGASNIIGAGVKFAY